jgi:protein-disulfide isomerase
LLFAPDRHRNPSSNRTVRRSARDIGLNIQKFEQDLANHTFLPRIEEDIESGERSGVEGTPTFFINGVKYNGSFELPYLLAAIEARAEI